ncbi:MAG: 3-hydroxyacyl-CoA dehydrogenase family protein [Hyphomicrobiales bacterium]|uniref:3-hydroxyacyl-CoA dehydrogenase family protein n=1 Tax=Aestuariivirga sp. TaxID=2650926 RepID=UPI0035B29DB2
MKPASEIERVAIIGNGLMGQGISQVFARAGKRVTLIGRNTASLQKALGVIAGNFGAFVDRGLASADEAEAAIARIVTSTDIGDAAGADHVIEAVPAVRETQLAIFETLDRVCAADIVLGSTSGQPISLMTGRMKTPERAVAMHFIYPAQLIPIVEVCGGPQTAPHVVKWACDVMTSVGQTPALMNKEVDGFIINRLQFAVLREAWSMWANGIASAEAIDNSFKLSLGRRYSITGPIESAELGGLDIMNKFAEFLLPDLDTSKAPPAAVSDLVKAGNFGLKSGKGVYDWSARDGKALLAARADKLFQHMKDDAAKG